MKYSYIDGDNIGLLIESSFLRDDELSLKIVNETVKNDVQNITKYLISKNQEIIFSGADGIICKGNDLNIYQTLEFIRKSKSNITFCIGSGNTLKDCYIALRYAKSNGKNIAVFLESNKFLIINE